MLKPGRIFGTIFAGIVAITLAIFLMASQIASTKMVVTKEAWRETLGSWDDIMARFPAEEANDAALKLEGLSAALGIDIATRTGEGRQRPSKEDARAHHKVKGQIGKYLERQLGRPARGVESPPEKLAAYLSEHAGELDAIRRELLGGDLPRWEMQLEKLFEATIPNLLGHIDLQKLLYVDALASMSEGDRNGAIADLEASWRLNTALRDRPIMITQLVAISIARMRAGTLRHVEDVPAEWRGRLSEHDFRDSLFDALLVESWLWSQIGEGAILGQGGSPWGRLVWAVARPYARFCIADISAKYRLAVLQLSGRKTLCDYDLAAGKSALDVPIPKWNFMAKIIVPNLGGVVDRVARLELDLELTIKLLQLEEARRAGEGRWPYVVPGIESSAVCPHDSWKYTFDADGSMSIAFSRDISWPNQLGVVLPTSYSAGP